MTDDLNARPASEHDSLGDTLKAWVDAITADPAGENEVIWESTALNHSNAVLSIKKVNKTCRFVFSFDQIQPVELPISFAVLNKMITALQDMPERENKEFHLAPFVASDYSLLLGTVWLKRPAFMVTSGQNHNIKFLIDPEGRAYLNGRERFHVLSEFKSFLVSNTCYINSILPSTEAEKIPVETELFIMQYDNENDDGTPQTS